MHMPIFLSRKISARLVRSSTSTCMHLDVLNKKNKKIQVDKDNTTHYWSARQQRQIDIQHALHENDCAMTESEIAFNFRTVVQTVRPEFFLCLYADKSTRVYMRTKFFLSFSTYVYHLQRLIFFPIGYIGEHVPQQIFMFDFFHVVLEIQSFHI